MLTSLPNATTSINSVLSRQLEIAPSDSLCILSFPWTSELLLMNRIQQVGWEVTSEIWLQRTIEASYPHFSLVKPLLTLKRSQLPCCEPPAVRNKCLRPIASKDLRSAKSHTSELGSCVACNSHVTLETDLPPVEITHSPSRHLGMALWETLIRGPSEAMPTSTTQRNSETVRVCGQARSNLLYCP